ncbi:MAG: hypothetical protein WDA07_10910 [Leucobacter sp.]
MHKDINKVIRESVSESQGIAAELLEAIVISDDWYSTLRAGYKLHGNAFIALLLMPSILDWDPRQILDLFEESHVLNAATESIAVELLLDERTWGERCWALNRDFGHDDLLSWDEDKLRVALHSRYLFIHTQNECVVFDRSAFDAEDES